jgi:hypothetical protein
MRVDRQQSIARLLPFNRQVVSWIGESLACLLGDRGFTSRLVAIPRDGLKLLDRIARFCKRRVEKIRLEALSKLFPAK